MAPMIIDAKMQPKIFFFLSLKITKVARKLARDPKATSNKFNDPKATIPPTAFPTEQPSVAPMIIGQPKSADKGRRQSAILS